jgi:hypothetical protein
MLGLGGCAALLPSPPQPPAAVESRVECDQSIFQRASEDRSSYFEIEARRLRADLKEAEAAMVAIESGMRSPQTRADAVTILAEARIALERASEGVPWRTEEAAEARGKLDEAESQLHANHLGTAIFFASRARRIADTLNEEALRVAREDSTRYIRARRVNLRGGPSTDHAILDVLRISTPVFPERHEGHWMLVRTLAGQVGWIHGQLLQ